MTYLIFCDFDGTVARRDIGYSLFHHFSGGKNDALLPDWKAGVMSSREVLVREAEMVIATENEIYDFLKQFELNAGFVEFVEKCRTDLLPLTILSDGLKFYIDYLLGRENLRNIPVLANEAFLENSRIRIEFPHENRACESCGSCKAERIAELRATFDGEVKTVFIGDGYSDACATKEADILFAKKDLEQYCLENNITYYKFDTFHDVTSELSAQGIFSR